MSPPARTTRRPAVVFASVTGAVLVVDQLVKAWAWRHVRDVHVNAGGDMLVGARLNAWYSGPLTGAVLDLVDTVVLAVLALALVRRARHPLTLVGGALLLAGWGSNLTDRLGTHFWTAPGAVRGVVDYLPWDGHYWNLADAVIGVGAICFAAGLARSAVGFVRRGHRQRTTRSRRMLSTPARCAAVAALVAVCLFVVLGALAYTGTNTPLQLAAAR